MKLKLVSDGTPQGTKVVDESGNVIENVRRIQLDGGLTRIPQLTITIEMPLTEGMEEGTELDLDRDSMTIRKHYARRPRMSTSAS